MSPYVLFPPPLGPSELHSFPTRRSSDLVEEQVVLAFAAGGRAVDRDLLAHSPRSPLGPATGFVHQDGLAAVTEIPRGDRKTTRLNSSHRCISYAVFCLKKKNIENNKPAE